MKKIDVNEIALNVRRTWGKVHPATKVFKSKKTYDRKNKSWKNDED